MNIKNWVLDPAKYLSKEEAEKLLAVARDRAEKALSRGLHVPVRDYFVIHLAMATGLRVMEIAALRCGDIYLASPISSLIVRCGKGSKKRIVFFNGRLRLHCEDFLAWKKLIGESTDNDSPLLLSSNTGGHMTTRAIQKTFKRCAKLANLPAIYSIHSLRHTHACLLLKASGWNLRLVQKQLGHARLSTTQVYADVMSPDIGDALERLNV